MIAEVFLDCDTLKVRWDSSIDHLLIMDSYGPGEGADVSQASAKRLVVHT